MKVSQKMIEKMENMVCIQDFREALQTYKKEKNKKRLKESTIIDYLYEVKLFFEQVELPHDQRPTLKQAQHWKENLDRMYPSKKTQAKKIQPVNLYLHLVCGYPEKSIDQVDNIERLHMPVKITREQVMQMVDFEESKGKYTEAMLIFVAFVTACRKAVLHRILIKDINFDSNTILLRKCKGNRDLTIPMNKNDMQRIKLYIDNHRPKANNGQEEYLFITNSGKKVYDYRIHRVLQYCAKELGFKVRVHPHALRRARVLDLRKQGYEWEEIIKITGHRKIEYLMPYLVEEDFNKVHRKLNQQDTISNSPPLREKTSQDKELELLKAQIELERLKNENLKMALNGIGKTPDKLDADPLGYGNYDTY